MTKSINSVVPTKATAGRGRRRAFDTETALVFGQAMFHKHGYDGVALAELTHQLGINPPSFYGAFGSKVEFFKQILERYADNVLPASEFYETGGPPEEVLTAFLEKAANEYSKDPEARGCLVFEAAREDGSSEATIAARRLASRRRSEVRRYTASTHPHVADEVADYVVFVMWGLSASARQGWTRKRLNAVARASAVGLRMLLNRGS